MALTDLVLDCKSSELSTSIRCFSSPLVYEMTNASRVDMSDFELLKVLGTGGKQSFLSSNLRSPRRLL